MKFVNKNQHGFSPVILIVCVIAIGVVGALGYVVYDKFIANDDSVVVEQSSVAEDMETVTTSAPEEIVDTSDLDEAMSALDQITDSETTKDINLITEQISEF